MYFAGKEEKVCGTMVEDSDDGVDDVDDDG